MSPWPLYPSIYEINTWVWLSDLGHAEGRAVNLATVPEKRWDEIAAHGFDAVWLMGVWERSPAGIAISHGNDALTGEFKRALSDFRSQDNVGSAYCIRDYEVDAHLGGRKALARARAALADRGMRLVLDFVPNHVAPDHAWAGKHPEYFVGGTAQDLARDPASFIAVGERVLACGRDPYFPAWRDVLQLNAFAPELRVAASETLSDIASQCDAVRCDMAMLMLNSVFERTWSGRVGARPAHEYWKELIPALHQRYPNFRFLAEAYWDLEWELQQQGFDYCYDKRLYDRLEHDSPDSVRLHLCAGLDYQSHLMRFLENHDEPRAATSFPGERERTAAVVALTLPGARLVHDGQIEGRKIHTPVFLGRRSDEPVNEPLRDFYTALLRATASSVFRVGQWQLCERSGWPDNNSYLNIVAWCWRQSDHGYVIVANLSPNRAQASVRLPWKGLPGRTWVLRDELTGESFERSGDQMHGPGLYVDLAAWGRHFLHIDGLSTVH